MKFFAKCMGGLFAVNGVSAILIEPFLILFYMTIIGLKS